MFLMPSAGVSSWSHQALTGSTGSSLDERANGLMGWRFLRISHLQRSRAVGDTVAKDSDRVAVVCSKETQHWWGWRLGERKRKCQA